MELLSTWQSQHRSEFMRLRASFADLRAALNTTTQGQKATKLKRILADWESLMLGSYDDVSYNLVPLLKSGYGTPTTSRLYKKETDMLPRLTNNARRLREYFDKAIGRE